MLRHDFLSCRSLLVFLNLLASGCSESGGNGVAAETDGGALGDAGGSEASGVKSSGAAIATSATHSCALRKAGLYCWGDNFAGQLGTGDTVTSDVPVEATQAGTDIVELALSTGRTCMRRSTGEVACLGLNEQGQIGDGTRTDSLRAVPALGINDARALALNDTTTCVLRAGGKVSCWGGAPASSREDGSVSPVRIDGLDGAVELRAGSEGDYCARGDKGWVRCWKLKDGAWTAPVELPVLRGARALALTGFEEVCAIIESGEIHCHNLESGMTVPLDGSAGSVHLTGAGLLAACAQNQGHNWHCWNVLPAMLETVGSLPIAITTDVPFLTLVITGFRACALRQDAQIACANANEITPPTAPTFHVLPGLPP